MSNDPNHNNDTFLQKIGQKTSFKNVPMATKILHVYISVTVPDKSIVTIIHRQELIYSLPFRTMTCDLQWPWRSQMVTYMSVTKNVFSQSVIELETSRKAKIVANSMRTAWYHFRRPLTYFRSRDVIKAIFGITAITPLFFKLKTSSKN